MSLFPAVKAAASEGTAVGKLLGSAPRHAPSTVVQHAGADIARNPRLVKQLDVIDATYRPIVERQGLRGLGAFLSKNKVKVGGAMVGAGLVSTLAYDELMSIAAGSDQLANAARAAIEEIDAVRRAAGLDSPTEPGDGEIAGSDASQITAHVGLYKDAEACYKKAVAAVGGRGRLIALMTWLTIDPDLQDIVLAADDE